MTNWQQIKAALDRGDLDRAEALALTNESDLDDARRMLSWHREERRRLSNALRRQTDEVRRLRKALVAARDVLDLIDQGAE